MTNIKEQKPSTFNYKDLYEKGQTVYYLRILPKLEMKEVLSIEIRTVYPDIIVGCGKDTSQAVYIGINERENIFDNRKDAMKKYKTIKFT